MGLAGNSSQTFFLTWPLLESGVGERPPPQVLRTLGTLHQAGCKFKMQTRIPLSKKLGH